EVDQLGAELLVRLPQWGPFHARRTLAQDASTCSRSTAGSRVRPPTSKCAVPSPSSERSSRQPSPARREIVTRASPISVFAQNTRVPSGSRYGAETMRDGAHASSPAILTPLPCASNVTREPPHLARLRTTWRNW